MKDQAEGASGAREEPGAKAASLVRTYVVRSGRMTEAQQRAIDEGGPHYIIPFAPRPLDAASSFPAPLPLVMEIGFGMGKATWQIALNRPEFNYLGVEVHGPGVGRLIMELRDHGLENLRIVQHDAVEVLESMIPAGSLAGLHVFYPDPWPKKRHHKRRLMRQPILDLMVSRLAPGGYLYFVTDIEEYGISTLELLSSCSGLANQYQGFAPRIGWRPETKFEARAKAESRPAFELYFVKV
jgi:tRNA (guanine-N7-)-methyltransferase